VAEAGQFDKCQTEAFKEALTTEAFKDLNKIFKNFHLLVFYAL
jgi:hypothetical protein